MKSMRTEAASSTHLSIVTTLYRSQAYVINFYQRASDVAKQITTDYELIFVDDGSPDESVAMVRQLVDEDPHVKLVQLSRNFGHHKAIMTGLDHTQGEVVFFADCDLEENPEHLIKFYKRLQSSPDVDVVYGVQQQREGTWFRRISGQLFYHLYNSLTAYNIPQDLTTMRLMRRPYVDALCTHKEQTFIIAVLWTLTGFNQVAYPIRKTYKGNTSYTFRKKLTQTVYGITSVSARPLIAIALLGLFVTLLTLIFGCIYFVMAVMGVFGVEGWATIVLSVLLLGGMNLTAMGIIAIYLSVIFQEVKARPYTTVKAVYHNSNHNSVPIYENMEKS